MIAILRALVRLFGDHRPPLSVEVPPMSPVSEAVFVGWLATRHDDSPTTEVPERHPDLVRKENPVADDTRRHIVVATRPCWACGDPAGFHVDHRPCWNVAPGRPFAPGERYL